MNKHFFSGCCLGLLLLSDSLQASGIIFGGQLVSEVPHLLPPKHRLDFYVNAKVFNQWMDGSSESSPVFIKNSKSSPAKRQKTEAIELEVTQEGGIATRSSGGGGDNPEKDMAKAPENAALDQLRSRLEKIGQLIKEKGIALVLVFDLDGTLYVYPENMLENFAINLNMERRHQIQQNWFDALSSFIAKFRANVYVIYNTSRTALLSHAGKSGWIDIDAIFTTSYNDFPQVEFAPIPHLGSNASFSSLGIPMPDALISDTGRVIHFGEVFNGLISIPDRERILTELNIQSKDAASEIKARHLQDFAQSQGNLELRLHPSSVQHRITINPGFMTLLQFETDLYKFGRATVVCPDVVSSDISRHELLGTDHLYYSSVVNKGSTLSLVMGVLVQKIIQTGVPAENIWEVTYGDGPADLAMLRPDLEVGAMSPVPSAYLDIRRDIFSDMGQDYDFDQAPYWKLAVVSCWELLTTEHGSWVKNALDHPKVKPAQGDGVRGFVSPLLEELEKLEKLEE